MVVAGITCDRAPRSPATPGTGEAGSLLALDGDSLRLPDGDTLRLTSIDTPERGRDGAEAARRFTQAFVDAGPARVVPAEEGRDRYDRLLGDVIVDGRSLSRALVEAGLAWIYPPAEPSLLSAQREAVAAGRGIHAGLAALDLGPLVLTSRRFHRADGRDRRWRRRHHGTARHHISRCTMAQVIRPLGARWRCASSRHH